MNNQLVSEAIVKYVNGSFPRSAEDDVERELGTEAAQDVRSIYDRAMDCPVAWSDPAMKMDTALGILADFIAAEWPELSPEAKQRLNYCYIMCWK